MDTYMNNSLTISNAVCQKRIVYISDLHFDFVKDTSKESGHRYAPKLAKQCQADFIDYVKKNYSEDILCLAGDFYNNVHKTLKFIKELEKNKIFGFFVLGNHDYWNNGTLSHKDIISMFEKETAEHAWYRFLSTSKKYYIDDLCFIGDTGWTSFRRSEPNRQVPLKQFMLLPDAKNVRDFDPKKIKNLHNKWIEFANEVLISEQKVIIITHFPMIDLTEYDMDCWWSSQTQLLNSENQWRIFGHTHKRIYGSNFNLTCQRGYNNKIVQANNSQLYHEIRTKMLKSQHDFSERMMRDFISSGQKDRADKLILSSLKYEPKEQEIQRRIDHFTNQYLPKDFDILYKASDSRELSAPFQNIMANYYTSTLVEEPNENSKLSRSVKQSGYRRSAANKINFAYLAYDKTSYLKRVREEIDSVVGLNKVRIGYYYKTDFVKKETIDALKSAADYLENNDMVTDVRAFITAAILTGYAWNRSIFWMDGMRPINDYDIARFFLQFMTMQKYNISFDKIYTVERSKKDKIAFGNIELWIPMVNGMQLTVEQVMIALSPTPLIEHVNPNGIKYKVVCQSCGCIWERNNKNKILRCTACVDRNKRPE